MARGYELRWYGDELKAAIAGATEDALFEGGVVLQEAAAARAPRASGTLAESAYTATESKSNYAKRSAVYRKEVKPGRGQAVVGFAAFYARFKEFGTRSLAAEPFLRPALDGEAARIGKRIVDVMKKGIK